MKSVVILEIDHDEPIPGLANKIAGRAWSLAGVKRAEVMRLAPATPEEMERAGFTLSEISLGSQEVYR